MNERDSEAVTAMLRGKGYALVDNEQETDIILLNTSSVRDHLTHIIATLQGQGPCPSSIVDLDDEAGSQNTIKAHMSETRQVTAFVSIMQGCNMKCSYCIVPKTRGAERAWPIDDIIDEIQMLAAVIVS